MAFQQAIFLGSLTIINTVLFHVQLCQPYILSLKNHTRPTFKASINEYCEYGSQCKPSYSVCQYSLCACQSGYVYNSNSGDCENDVNVFVFVCLAVLALLIFCFGFCCYKAYRKEHKTPMNPSVVSRRSVSPRLRPESRSVVTARTDTSNQFDFESISSIENAEPVEEDAPPDYDEVCGPDSGYGQDGKSET